jgi:GDP-D-mannose 3',5'-epimerase
VKSVTLITGAGGFVGHHLACALVDQGRHVRGVDRHLPRFAPSPAQEWLELDLRDSNACRQAVEGVDEIFHLAADTGGIAFVTRRSEGSAQANVAVTESLLQAATTAGVKRFLFASSVNVLAHHGTDAPTADYGWEKLNGEALCLQNRSRMGIRIARLHNVYGTLDQYDGPKAKALMVFARTVALAGTEAEVEIWGSGSQSRVFIYVKDCVEGMIRLMKSNRDTPLNLGGDNEITVNELLDCLAEISGKRIIRKQVLNKPEGVMVRQTLDVAEIRRALGWVPLTPFREGLKETYRWVEGRTGR